MTLLEISNLSAWYGSSQALFGVSLEVGEGETIALMGRNGMGKSTTVKCICRMIPAKGALKFGSQDLLRLPSHRAVRLGIGLVPEGRRCFPNLTVFENLTAAARRGEWDFGKVSGLFPRLSERRSQKASSLSGGEQQMLSIGRALMTNPKLLVMDEATEGLAPLVRREIWEAVGRLKRESGLSLLVIDKSVKELREVCDGAVFLERGRTAWRGRMTDLTSETVEKYAGV